MADMMSIIAANYKTVGMTIPTKTPSKAPVPAGGSPGSRGTPVWTYVAVGFVFGLVLLGVYRMVVLFSN